MKKLKDKIEEKDILEDIDKIINYIDNLSNLDIENTDLNKFEKEINSLGNEFNEKYKKYLPKDNLDPKK